MLIKIDLIDYQTLQNLKPEASFLDADNMTYASAAYLFGKNSLGQQAVRKAWTGVGINVVDSATTIPCSLPGLVKRFKIQPG